MKKIRREIGLAFPGAEVKVNGRNHYTVRLQTGGTITVSGTPKYGSYLKQAVAEARRQSKKAAAIGETK